MTPPHDANKCETHATAIAILQTRVEGMEEKWANDKRWKEDTTKQLQSVLAWQWKATGVIAVLIIALKVIG